MSACGNCEALREEIDRLKRELGVRREAGEIGAVMDAFGVPATHARLLLRLYAAGGRAVPREMLMDELSTLSDGNLRANIYALRQTLGDAAIISLRGDGYALGVPALSRIMGALTPPLLARTIAATDEAA